MGTLSVSSLVSALPSHPCWLAEAPADICGAWVSSGRALWADKLLKPLTSRAEKFLCAWIPVEGLLLFTSTRLSSVGSDIQDMPRGQCPALGSASLGGRRKVLKQGAGAGDPGHRVAFPLSLRAESSRLGHREWMEFLSRGGSCQGGCTGHGCGGWRGLGILQQRNKKGGGCSPYSL